MPYHHRHRTDDACGGKCDNIIKLCTESNFCCNDDDNADGNPG